MYIEQQRKLFVQQQQKQKPQTGQGDVIQFDLGDLTTYDIHVCPVGLYLDGKTFQEIHNILTSESPTMPVCKKEDRTPDEECIKVLYRTIVYKEGVNIANIVLDSNNHLVDLHTDTHLPQSKQELWEKTNKSVFDSSQAQYNFRNQDRHKVLQTIFKVHKDCETVGTDKAEIKYHHLKIYDKQRVFQLLKFRYGFKYDYGHQLGRFSKQTRQSSGPFGCTEDNFTLLYQSSISVTASIQLVETKQYLRQTKELQSFFHCRYRYFTMHPFGLGNPNEDLQLSQNCRHFKDQDCHIEKLAKDIYGGDEYDREISKL